MADWNTPVLTSTYVSVLDSLKARDADLAVQFSPTYSTATNLPTGTVRWNPTNGVWEIRSAGGTWSVLASIFNINVDKLDGQDGAHYLAWANLTGVPSTFAPSAHNHDDRYYTETESDGRYGNNLAVSGNTILLRTAGNATLTTITAPFATNAGTVGGFSVGQNLLTTSAVSFGNATLTGPLITNGFVTAGQESGSVALTVNDAFGGANVTFNHRSGIPDAAGSSARITANVDSTTASMNFQLKSNITVGVAAAATTVLSLTETAIFGTVPFYGPTTTTQALPGFTFNGDVDTGVFRPDANTLGLTTAGVERLRIEADGDVGIGTTTASALLHIRKTAVGTIFLADYNANMVGQLLIDADGSGRFQVGNASGLPTIQLNSSGPSYINNNLGVGTFVPATKLHVSEGSSGVTPAASTVGFFESTAGAILQIATSSTTDAAQIRLSQGGVSGQGLITATSGLLSIQADGALRLNSANLERVRIDTAGNVGIGLASPTQKLHVSGNILSTGSIDAGTQFLGQAADSQGAPSFSFTGDADSGVFRPDVNSVGITTAGVERFRVNAVGALRINAAYGVAGAVLSSNGSAAGNTWETVGSLTADLAVGAVGSYAMLRQTTTNTARTPGATLAGTNLVYENVGGNSGGTTGPAGTWRLMARLPSGAANTSNTAIWLRIS